jgi:hypothetical protein
MGTTPEIISRAATPASTIERVQDNLEPLTGPVARNGGTNDPNLVLTGQAVAGSTVQVFDGNALLGTTTSDASGQWTFAAEDLPDGKHDFKAKAKAEGSSLSPASAKYSVIVDTEAPKAPTINAVTDDEGSTTGKIANNASTDDATPTLSGKAEALSSVELFDPSFRTPLVIIAHFIRVERCHPPKIPVHPARTPTRVTRWTIMAWWQAWSTSWAWSRRSTP